MDKTFDEHVLLRRALRIFEEVMGFTSDTKLRLEVANRLHAAVLAEGGTREPVAWRIYWHPAWPEEPYWLCTDDADDLRRAKDAGWTCQPLYAAPIAPPPAGPVSPLLPGLERAIHVVELTAWQHDVPPFDQHLIVDAIRAEISRLKGEGRGS